MFAAKADKRAELGIENQLSKTGLFCRITQPGKALSQCLCCPFLVYSLIELNLNAQRATDTDMKNRALLVKKC